MIKPEHYKVSPFEIMEIIELQTLEKGRRISASEGLMLGLALKYIIRAYIKHESPDEDIQKTITCLTELANFRKEFKEKLGRFPGDL